MLSQLSKVIPPEVAVFGEVPWSNYTVMQIVDSAYGGASGLEHQSSHVDVLAPNFVGLYQFNIVVPQVADGDYQINITVGGVKVPQTIFLTVHK